MKGKIRNIRLFNYRSDTLTVPVEVVRLEDASFHLLVKVEIDGIQGDMIIDTGASVTVVDQQLFPEKVKDTETATKLQSGSVNGQIEEVRLIHIDCLKIGGRKLKDMQLAAIDLAYVNDMYDKHLHRKIIGLLGCDFCVRYHAVIDYSSSKITLNFRQKPGIGY